MQKDQAYKVWRAGVVDDFDDEYLKIYSPPTSRSSTRTAPT